MKVFLNIFTAIILINFVTVTKEDSCNGDKISISPLGKCKSITEFLGNESLTIKTENLMYLASNDGGKIEIPSKYKLEIYKLNDSKLQSHNMRKSKLYISKSCLNQMKNNQNIKLDENKGIVILVYDYTKRNQNNLADKYFIIRHNSPGSNAKFINSKTFDLSICHEDPILFEDEENIANIKYNMYDANPKPLDINTILYGRKFGIDLFDPYSDFLNDICFKFTSEKGTDVTMDSRLEDYYQNISFCDDYENSHYLSYNYSAKDQTITYRCAFGYYKSEADKSGYLDIIDTELKSLVSVSNIKVITCYRKFLNLRDIIRNYGGMICILVLIIQIICFLIFCFSGIKPIEEKLENLFILGASILKSLMKMVNLNTEKDNLIDGQPRKKFNLWGTIREIIKKKKGKQEKEKQENKEKEKKENKLELIDMSNPPGKKRKSLKSNKLKVKKLENEPNLIKISDVNEEKDINHDDEAKTNNDNTNEKINKEKKNDRKKKTVKFADNGETPGNNDKKEKKEKDKLTDDQEDEKKTKKTQIYDYENDELNELPFKKARKYDKRGFCKFYWNILMFSHIILNVFFRHNDYNLFTVKLGLLFMTFPINLGFNILFYTNKNIKLNYSKALDDLSGFWNNIANTVYSSLLSTTLLIMLKFICLTHNSVRVLRKFKDIDYARKKSICVLRCIKIRVVIYYVLSFAFLAIFGYYILCFCAIFENTQIELVKSTFTSWLISLIYPLIICLITSIFRALSFKCNNRILYRIKNLMQML